MEILGPAPATPSVSLQFHQEQGASGTAWGLLPQVRNQHPCIVLGKCLTPHQFFPPL